MSNDPITRFTITFKNGYSITKEFPLAYDFKDLVEKSIKAFEFENKTMADFHDITATADDTMFDNEADYENYMCEHDSDPLIEIVMDMDDDPPNNQEKKLLEERRKHIKELKEKIEKLKEEKEKKLKEKKERKVKKEKAKKEKVKKKEKELNDLIIKECSLSIPNQIKNSANSFKDFMAQNTDFKNLKFQKENFKKELEDKFKPVEEINQSFKDEQEAFKNLNKELDTSKFSTLETSAKKLNNNIDSFNKLKRKQKQNCLFNINEENVEKAKSIAKRCIKKLSVNDDIAGPNIIFPIDEPIIDEPIDEPIDDQIPDPKPNIFSNISSNKPSNINSNKPSNINSNKPSNISSNNPSNISSNKPSNISSNKPSNINSNKPSNISSNDPAPPVDDISSFEEKFIKLKEILGGQFDDDYIRKALKETNGDIAIAMNILQMGDF